MTIDITITRKVFPAQHDAPERLVFEDFHLTLAAGEICAVTGPSGTGKSSLLQIVAGLDRDYEGRITGLSGPLGYLFQAPRLLPWRTTGQNLELVLPDAPEEAARWLARVGLAGSEGVYPQRLSVGMARRVSLARALCVRPALLLLDEPFTALDGAMARQMHELVREELHRLRPTTLLVTHSGQEAAALADRIILLEGSPARIVDDRPTLRTGTSEGTQASTWE
jgi:ABC-type nitrate/sulfonate/bicarbonate transport system ATPase subunit